MGFAEVRKSTLADAKGLLINNWQN
jgi:hypothetical protein